MAIGRGLCKLAAGADGNQLYEGLSPQDGARGCASAPVRDHQAKGVSLNEGGVPMPVQSVVEGAKLATFIDEAVEDSIKELEHQDGVSRMEKDSLHEINGKVFIQSMSVDVVQFVADAYRCLRY